VIASAATNRLEKQAISQFVLHALLPRQPGFSQPCKKINDSVQIASRNSNVNGAMDENRLEKQAIWS